MKLKKWWNDGAVYMGRDKDGDMYTMTNGERVTFMAVIVTAACLLSAVVACFFV